MKNLWVVLEGVCWWLGLNGLAMRCMERVMRLDPWYIVDEDYVPRA